MFLYFRKGPRFTKRKKYIHRTGQLYNPSSTLEKKLKISKYVFFKDAAQIGVKIAVGSWQLQ